MTEIILSSPCGRPFKTRIGLAIHARRCSICTPEALFWMKVDKTMTGCWLYTGFIKWDGYGWLARQVEGRTKYMTAHRYSWILRHGMPPKGMSIMHKCDVAACCNPDHLQLGTHAENMADCAAKGRNNSGQIMKYKPVLFPNRVRPRRTA